MSGRGLVRGWLPWGLALALAALHAGIFAALFARHALADQPLHADVVRAMLASHAVPGDFLFYATVGALAGLQQSKLAIEIAMVAVLTAAVLAKCVLSMTYAEREKRLAGGRSELPGWVLVVAVALASLAFSLPTAKLYLGQLPPNIWHNSTTIFVMPFALVLFWATAQLLRGADGRWAWVAAVAGAVNVAAKPSLVLALLPVFPLLAIARLRRGPRLWRALGVSAVIAAVLAVQYLYIFASDSNERVYAAAGFVGEATSHIRIAPFHVWSFYSSDIPLSIAASFPFAIVALLVYRRRLLEYDLVRYALALVGVSLVVFALFSETGVREYHGNFAWQAMITNYILLLVVLIRVWSLWSFRRERVASVVVAAAFLAQVLAGAAFLAIYLARGTYV